MSNRDDTDRTGTSFGLIVSAAVLALIIVVGIFAFVGGRDTSSVAPPSADAPTAVPPPSTSGAATGFGTPDVDLYGRRVDIPNDSAGQPLPQDEAGQKKQGDPDWLTAAPKGTTGPGGWQRVFGASVPFSTSDGPSRIESGTAVGFAHTPQGAVLAAAQITYRLNARPADRDLYTRQLQVTPQQVAAFDKAVADQKVPTQQPDKVTRYLVATDAFQVENYAQDLAIVRIAARGPVVDGESTWLATRLVMVWQDGDWKLKPVTGKPQTETVKNLVGWTAW